MTYRQLVSFVGLAGLTLAGCKPSQNLTPRVGEQSDATEPTAGMPGMNMEEISDGRDLRLSAEDFAQFGVTFGLASRGPLVKNIRTVGTIDFDETKMSWVAPKFGGWAEQLFVNFTGQSVRAGDPLLSIYSPELVAAQEELILARSMADSLLTSSIPGAVSQARNLLDATRRRLSYWGITSEQIADIENTGRVDDAIVFSAPRSGTITEKRILEGEAFQPGDPLYMIADLSRVWVNLEMFEGDIGLLSEGTPVDIRLSPMPGRSFSTHIEFIYPTLTDATRSLRVRVSLENPGGELKPGMYVTAQLSSELGTTLSVPTSAVLQTGDQEIVFVNAEDGRLSIREVVLGRSGSERIEILEGLDEGDSVVTSAQFLLDSESNLAEVMQAMMAQMNPTDIQSLDMGEMNEMQMPETPDTLLPRRED